jgi:putative ABC transport system substrate-binding protein
MIRRREFIAGLGSAAAWPLAARGQQGNRVRRIGGLMAGVESRDRNVPAFIQALANLGWTEGRNVRMDLRWHGGDTNRIRALAQELVGLQPDIIMAGGNLSTVAVERETRTIPIVFASLVDPVASSMVERLDRPTGNVTGFGGLEATLGGKWLELLSEIAPGLKRVAIMFNPDMAPASIFIPSLEMAGRLLKVVPIIAPVHSDVEIETAVIALGRGRLALLRTGLGRHLSSRRHLCRSHSARREARRATRSAADQVRDGREPQDRQGAWPCGTPIDPAAR